MVTWFLPPWGNNPFWARTSSVSRFHGHTETPHLVGLLCTSDQPDVETCIWQHRTLTRDRYPCRRRDSNQQLHQASCSSLRPRGHWCRPGMKYIHQYFRFHCSMIGRDISFRVETRLQATRPRDGGSKRLPYRQNLQTVTETHSSSVQGAVGFFSSAVKWLGCLSDPRLHLVSMLRLCGAIPVFPLYAFLLWTWTNFGLSVYTSTGFQSLRIRCWFWRLTVQRGELPTQLKKLQYYIFV